MATFQRDSWTCQQKGCGLICYGTGSSHDRLPICDHIKPHKGDMDLFHDANNLQTLCKRCHDIKTAMEDGGLNSGAQTHPEWLPAPACQVVLVTGPPGGGKTTYCRSNAEPGDTIIDLDDMFQLVSGKHGHDADPKHLTAALRARNKMISQLATQTSGKAYLIVSAPAQAEVDWWINKLSAQHTLICPSIDEIKDRHVGTKRIALARKWFSAKAANAWKPAASRKTISIGVDGWPEG